MISFDDFKKVEITVGKILSVEKVPETDKLLRLSVDFGIKQNPSTLQKAVLPLEKGESDTTTTASVKEGDTTTPASGHSSSTEERTQERDIRQIVSGIALYFPDIQVLVGKKCMFVTNLEPRTIRGLESNGMLFAVSTEDGKFSILEPNADIPEGTKAK